VSEEKLIKKSGIIPIALTRARRSVAIVSDFENDEKLIEELQSIR